MKPVTAGDIVATTGQQKVQSSDIPPELRQMLNAPAYALQEIRLTVVSTVPKGIVHITGETEVELRPEYTEAKETRRADVTYDDLGGIGTRSIQLREMVELPLRYPEIFERPWSRSAQGRASPWPARHRQDEAGARRGERERGYLLSHCRAEIMGSALWREREEASRGVRAGDGSSALRSSSSMRLIRSLPSVDRCRARPRRGSLRSC
jgi:transitional endoplasmic reticulum ATPase